MTISKQQFNYFKDSKVKDEAGELLVVYHGTGTYIKEFSNDFTGKGNDQYGSGFYFTTDYDTANGYATSTIQDNKGNSIEKLGGMDHPNVIEAYLNITNPIYIDGKEQPSMRNVRFTFKQVSQIIRKLPSLYILPNASTETADIMNPLGDYYEEYWSAKSLNDLKPLINKLIREYFKDTDYYMLDRLFESYPTTFRYAINSVCGYDGVKVEFDDTTHYIAWFPEQIKRTTNVSPTFCSKIDE